MKKNDFDNLMKDFYEGEVQSASIPPLPTLSPSAADTLQLRESEGRKRDRYILAALVAASLILLSLPGVYENTIRRSTVHIYHIEAYKESFPEIVYEASMGFKQNKVNAGASSEDR